MAHRSIASQEELEFMPIGSWVSSNGRLYRKTLNEQDHLPYWLANDSLGARERLRAGGGATHVGLTSSYLWRIRVNLSVPGDLEILAESLK